MNQPRQTLPVIILDRDGVINEDSPHYIKSVEEFVFLPGSIEAIVRLHLAGYQIGVATNQSGLARGFYDEVTLTSIHEKMLHQVLSAGGSIDEIIYCPHLPEAGCDCRKPRPGMLIELSRRFGCQTRDLIFIGDKMTDVQAALAVGATPMMVTSPMTEKSILQAFSDILRPVENSPSESRRSAFGQNPNRQQPLVFDSLILCVDHIVKQEKSYEG